MMLILPVIAYVLWFAVFQLRYQSRREAQYIGGGNLVDVGIRIG